MPENIIRLLLPFRPIESATKIQIKSMTAALKALRPAYKHTDFSILKNYAYEKSITHDKIMMKYLADNAFT